MNWWKWLLAGALAIGCLALLISQVTLSDLTSALGQVKPTEAIAGFGIVLVSYFLKALRFRTLLGKAAPFRKLFGITVAQNVLAQLVPARAGDVGYVLMVKKSGMASLGYGLATLLVCRLLDLVILAGMYAWSLCVLDLKLPAFRQAAYWVGALVAAGLGLAIALVVFRRRATSIAQRVLEKTRLLRLHGVRYLWNEMLDAFPHLGQLKLFRHLLPMFVLSLLIWAATAAWIYLIWRAVNVPLNLPQLLFIFSLAYILGLFPLFFLGGVGTVDVVNTGVLMSFGIASAEAAKFTLCNRALAVLYLLGLVLVAVALLGRGLAKATTPEEKADRG
jgi:hypothetical protein